MKIKYLVLNLEQLEHALEKKLVKEQTLSGDFRVCHLVHTMQCSYASSLVLSVLKKVCNFND